jgi:hypothetical protein
MECAPAHFTGKSRHGCRGWMGLKSNEWIMRKNPILSVPLTDVMRFEIALPLQQVLQIYTVGGFLSAWANPKNQKSIERVFDSPQQARHAATVCAAWLGVKSAFVPSPVSLGQWWRSDEQAQGIAQ